MKKSNLYLDVLNYHLLFTNTHDISFFQFLKYLLSFKILPVTLIRLIGYLDECSVPFFPRLLQFLNFTIYGIECRPKCSIGGGLFLPHTQGTVIGARSIGINCTIYQGVTIGASRLDILDTDELRPIIEDNVVIGAGAKIIGPVTVGSSAIIGANVVVVEDIPAGSLVVLSGCKIL